ncbi:MAG: hypothetical protein EA397_06955 [Deltaproteobacteria bacterium]|nr:MAG: hypothetical protein EA397_06955 [Deltaproteobacteria bacterium]
MTRLLIPLIALAAAACEPIAEGLDGNLAFGYDADDRLFPFDFGTPVAEGMGVDVLVYDDAESRQPMTVSSAQAQPGTVAEVVGFEDNRVSLGALARGEAEVQVTAGDLSDRFTLSVESLETVELSYPGVLLVSAEPPVRVMQGGTTRFGARLLDSAGRTLVGYGLAPVEILPASAGSQIQTHHVAHVSVRFDELGDVTVSGQGGEALTVEVVDPATLSGLELEGLRGSQVLEDRRVFAVRGLDENDDNIFGLSDLITVSVDDESVCTVRPRPALGDSAFEVLAVTIGDCTVRATYESHDVAETFPIVQAQ